MKTNTTYGIELKFYSPEQQTEVESHIAFGYDVVDQSKIGTICMVLFDRDDGAKELHVAEEINILANGDVVAYE